MRLHTPSDNSDTNPIGESALWEGRRFPLELKLRE